MNWTQILSAAAIAAGLHIQAAAPATPQGFITGSGYYNIGGTAVANLTNNAKFPNSPDAMFFLPYFEWNATGDISVAPGNFADNYGARISGYFYPPATGDYIFYIAADDNASLFLSTNAEPANKKLIARETSNSGARIYTTSTASDNSAKDSSLFTASEWPVKDPGTGLARITLQANQPVYIEALVKEGGGGDDLSVAVADPGGAIDFNLPIPGQYLSSDRSAGPIAVLRQPASVTVPERGSTTFSVLADGTPPYSFQWRKDGQDIPDATNMTLNVNGVAVADSNAKYSVSIVGGQGTITSQDAVLTVAPDTAPPRIVSAKGNPNLTEVTLTYSEPIDPVSAAALANYSLSSSGGALNVTGATVSPSGTQVTLTTAQQTLGTKYTLLVSGVKDTAAAPNTIAANSKVVFFPSGRIVETGGMVVIEAENWDRNTDDIWIRNTTRGIPSAGASVVAPNGAGGNTGSQVQYDVEFAQAATYQVWIRASGDNGNDDSVWFYLDGDGDGTVELPVERSSGNQASMTGFQPQTDFVWRSDSQDGPDPFTVDIPAPGLRTIALARREDGSFVDKIILTTDTAFNPTGFGPSETRQGAPGLPTVTLTGPANGATFAGGANVTLTSTGAGQSGLEIARVEYSANGNLVGVSTNAPFSFTWTNVPGGIYSVRATAYDEIGQSAQSGSAVITVGTPPPQALLVVGTESDPNLNPSDAGIKARLESQGWQVTVAQAPVSTTAMGEGKHLIIVSSTVNSGDVAAKFRASTAGVLMWEQAVQDDFLTTLNTDGTDRGTTADQTQISIIKADHPLAAGLTTGLKTVTTNLQGFSWGVPNSNAVVIATIADDPTRAVIYGYDKDAILIDGTTKAAGRRTMFFSGNGGFAAFTQDAVKLFDAAVTWTSGVEPKPTGAKIAWVSFHTSETTPSAAAATAGFTEPPDVGYTRRLKEAGHDVTRIRTSGTPDAGLLNAYDLVIISRSVPSGDYETAAEATAWNGIAKPMMILGGYVIRANRLGFATGNTIPDTTGPIKLKALAPSHPIFAGVPLDANGTMVNDYAGIMTFNGTTERGISVVTDPVVSGGTVLATITSDGVPPDGTIIAEFPTGTTLANGAASKLAAPRLVFLTGSREHNGLTSEGAGIYDLTADGAKLFLNAVKYMAGDDETEPPSLAVRKTPTGLIITYDGALQFTDTLGTRNWQTVQGATSPHPVTADRPTRFYRAVR